MIGIKRIYKKRATVKRPENTERPTKGLVRREESDRSQSRKLFSKKRNLTNRARGAASAQIRVSREGVWNQ
jgi:hypothetical protein